MISKAYTIFDPITGEVLRSGTAPERLLSKQVRAGESIWVGVALCDVQFSVERGEDGALSANSNTLEGMLERAPDGWRPTATAADASDLVEAGINPGLARRFAQVRMDQAWGELLAAQEAPLTQP